MSIYTKTGDKGETGLFSLDPQKPVRVSKSSLRVETIGTVDELNSFLGIVEANLQDSKFKNIILDLQRTLFTIGAILAGAKLRFSIVKTKKLEKQIDEWENQLAVLKNFILPGGSKTASLVFYARTICRRLERRLVDLSREEKLNLEILKFVNRLSDFLFCLGRTVNKSESAGEVVWKRYKDN